MSDQKDEQGDDRNSDGQHGGEPLEPVASFGSQLADAARKAGLGKLAEDERLSPRDMLGALGGIRGLAETIVPGLVFLVIFSFTQNLNWALGLSVALAAVFTLLRIVAKTPVMQAVAGLIGVVVSAALALWTGNGADNFVLGLITNAVYALVLLVSMLVRWPLIGLAAGYLMGDGLAWRQNKRRFQAMQLLTACWFGLFALRLVVQLPLYFANNVEGLAVTKLLMGVPLYALLLIVSWLIVRAVYPKATDAAARRP
ncbi:DUF3159 domain-containing protein [Microterricola viridarii]|uniref:DUF3159 domain-containing protein n=1 Tax=Microterricola viridarii TaxID=412690 RepID=A0A0X8E0Z0_9MICO|nr:DUF3159 domain-containing protein [Microterricola viridarii]AMB58299.1 hypothetical protein AWU67_04895 [Microterricola viridarii]